MIPLWRPAAAVASDSELCNSDSRERNAGAAKFDTTWGGLSSQLLCGKGTVVMLPLRNGARLPHGSEKNQRYIQIYCTVEAKRNLTSHELVWDFSLLKSANAIGLQCSSNGLLLRKKKELQLSKKKSKPYVDILYRQKQPATSECSPESIHYFCDELMTNLGKRGIEKQPFQLPDFIAATLIEKIRQESTLLYQVCTGAKSEEQSKVAARKSNTVILRGHGQYCLSRFCQLNDPTSWFTWTRSLKVGFGR
ncbi:hypothetical protein Vadar_009049 [Vaccinium darrowii]|uniref:Uncharacterized protein n=1 Tax=Vaccinium darrowii TaxID=229202 RepID=A0ACB7X8P4_9ERIC|nr:hypothetical protein Vadar_009049 [Vaccinium darrowii]